MKLNKKIVASLAATVAMFGSVSANAVTKTGNFDILANVISSCYLETQNIDFGSVQVTNPTDTVANSSVKVVCSKGVGYNVTLSGGLSTDPTARQMALSTNPDERLNYSILINDGATEFNWGTDEGQKLVQSGVQNDEGTKTFNIKAVIPGSQFVTPGSYSDTLTATINY